VFAANVQSSPSKETAVYNEAKTLFFKIRLWDADKLINAILENDNQLPDETQSVLP